jgi:type VI secretion system protein VasG
MTPLDIRRLVSKLGEQCKRSLEEAIRFALLQGHYNVELEHWLLKLLDVADSDLALCFKHYDVDPGRLAGDLNQALERIKKGNTRSPGLSQQLVALMQESWIVASVTCESSFVRSGHLLLTLVSDDVLSRWTREASRELQKISAERLRAELGLITAGSVEAVAGGEATVAAAKSGATQSTGGTALNQFTIDLTERARGGKIDPVLGREAEIRQVIDILMRRRQNNPILTGEAGVGKTSVVEGFALKIASGDVPPALQNVAVRTLDLGLLQAGAGLKGEFENRLKQVIDDVKSSATPIILFIDEAHTLIGAGGQAGQNDAANLLKPALARGELRTVAATTWAEYKKYFERDAALTRRFQVVKVEEPADPAAIDMMRGLVRTLEAHHGVRILDAAVTDSVRLSRRYIPARQLPDKSVSILDTACARVAMSQSAVPAEIDDRRQRIASLDTEITILTREAALGGEHAETLDHLRQQKDSVADELHALEERWGREKALVGELRELRKSLDPSAASPSTGVNTPKPSDAALKDFESKRELLRKMQGETPLVHAEVDAPAVATVVGNWTGIPVGRMISNEIKTVLNLKELMAERIIGQPQALDAIAQAMRTSRAQLTDPRKPIGVFLMIGSSGVGKTETALTLAELLYGGDQNLTVINMSEFKEEHKVSMLVGSPPGYVGYGEGGVLTEAVRRRPYSVVLLDEIEKAHPGVQDVFYQVFDKGQLRDGEGRDIDFKNTVIIMTSNAASATLTKFCADPQTMPDAAGLVEAVRPELLKIFKPAFLGRVTIVPYYPLTDEVLRQIVRLQLERIRRRVSEHYKASCTYAPGLVENIAARCHEVESGARNVESILSRGLLPELSSRILAHLAEGDTIREVRIESDQSGNFAYDIKSTKN